MYRYDWKDNKPYYPAYGMNDETELFIKEHGDDVNAFAMMSECWEHSPDEGGNFSSISREEISIGDGIRGITISITAEELRELEFVAVFSDGPTQLEGIDWRHAIVDLMAFKNTNGVFVKRRMNRMMKTAVSNGNTSWDDVAMSCIHIIFAEGDETDDDADSDK